MQNNNEDKKHTDDDLENYFKKASLTCSDNSISTEQNRDAMRFHIKWCLFCTVTSLLLVTVAHLFTLTRPIGESFITSTDGKVIQIKPIAIKQR